MLGRRDREVGLRGVILAGEMQMRMERKSLKKEEKKYI